MKTIFVTIYDGEAEKNILRSQVFPLLKESGHRIVLLVRGKERLEYYKNTFSSERVFVESLPDANSKREILWYHISRNSIPTRAVYVRSYREYQVHKNIRRYVLERTLSYLSFIPLWRYALRMLYGMLGEDYARELFDTYRPDLMFAQNMFSAEDCRLVLAAKRRGIKTISAIKSWDVLPTKAFTRVHADRLITLTQYNFEEATTYGDYPPSKVVIAGFPQFDVYSHADIFMSREDFCRSVGLDPKKNFVFYGIPGDWKLPYTKDVLERLDTRIEQGAFARPLQVFASVHPKYSDASETLRTKHVVLRRAGTQLAGGREFNPDAVVAESRMWTFTDDDIRLLANSMRHASLVICTDSTLTLDAAALNRPTVLIAFDGNQRLSYKRSIFFIYEREHYQNVIRTGGVVLAKRYEDLESAINTFLTNPEYLRAERNILIHALLGANDGKAGERMAHAVLEMLQ